MSFSKPKKPDIPAAAAPSPKPKEADTKRIKDDTKERNRRKRGRAASNVTGGLLRPAQETQRLYLRDTFG